MKLNKMKDIGIIQSPVKTLNTAITITMTIESKSPFVYWISYADQQKHASAIFVYFHDLKLKLDQQKNLYCKISPI